ncbi:cupin domain protein [Rhodotorula toruloides]|uniref:Cupin domain protein n=1 Tax=Rhodotorula toruloides TaxID=5286 RepID=A0A511KII1_RHOTO|nr:cupin domain protein [Rhodotorula toruloides]
MVAQQSFGFSLALSTVLEDLSPSEEPADFVSVKREDDELSEALWSAGEDPLGNCAATDVPPLVRPSRDAADPTAKSYFGGDLLAWELKDDEGRDVVRNRFKAGSKHTGNGRNGTAVPPLHIHLYETEIQGSMTYTLDGKEGIAKPGDKLVIPPGAVHTFWLDAGAKEDLVVTATAMGSDKPGFDHRFVRNFFGYLSSCVEANVAPSPFQIFLLLDSANVTLATPFGFGRLMNLALGRFVGGWLLGYQLSYKVFDDDGKTQ